MRKKVYCTKISTFTVKLGIYLGHNMRIQERVHLIITHGSHRLDNIFFHDFSITISRFSMTICLPDFEFSKLVKFHDWIAKFHDFWQIFHVPWLFHDHFHFLGFPGISVSVGTLLPFPDFKDKKLLPDRALLRPWGPYGICRWPGRLPGGRFPHARRAGRAPRQHGPPATLQWPC